MTQARLRAQKAITIKEVDIDRVLLKSKEEIERHLAEVIPILTDLFEKSEDEAYALINVDLEGDATTPGVVNYLKTRVTKFSKSTTDTTNEKIRRELIEAAEANETIPEMADRIGGLFDDMSKTRSELIARTESIRTMNAATEEAFKESGVVEAKIWTTNPGACPVCASLEGKRVALGTDFLKLGDTVTGEDGAEMEITFEDVPFPPIHPNCKCGLSSELIEI